MKKIMVIIMAAIFSITTMGLAFAAEQKPAAKAPVKAPAMSAPGMTQGATGPKRMMHPNFGIIAGSIVRINNSDPAKPRIEVKSDTDNTIHVIDLTPYTNVTKITDISELKAGESVRVMSRKVDDKDVALTVMFGKFKAPPMRLQPMRAPAAQVAPAASKK